MPVSFLSTSQRESYGRDIGDPSPQEHVCDEFQGFYFQQAHVSASIYGVIAGARYRRHAGRLLDGINNMTRVTLMRRLPLDCGCADPSKEESHALIA